MNKIQTWLLALSFDDMNPFIYHNLMIFMVYNAINGQDICILHDNYISSKEEENKIIVASSTTTKKYYLNIYFI